ncbi:hypothetical protein TNCV_1479291 [Trichonephila clavipes]|nr:hypothetical protein TNCV_1479291 [Trichonephila clavipes]
MITAGHRVNKSSSAHTADGSSTNNACFFALPPPQMLQCRRCSADWLAPSAIGMKSSFVWNIGCLINRRTWVGK